MGQNHARARGLDHAYQWRLDGQLGSVMLDNDLHPLDGVADTGKDGVAAARRLLFVPRFAGRTAHRPIAAIEIIQLNAPRKQVPVPARRPLS